MPNCLWKLGWLLMGAIRGSLCIKGTKQTSVTNPDSCTNPYPWWTNIPFFFVNSAFYVFPDDVTCDENQFKCRNSSHCIPKHWTCDGTFDCADKSDEFLLDCPADGHSCPENEFLCPVSKDCIHVSWLCDSDFDCSDGADEFNCKCCQMSLVRSRLVDSPTPTPLTPTPLTPTPLTPTPLLWLRLLWLRLLWLRLLWLRLLWLRLLWLRLLWLRLLTPLMCFKFQYMINMCYMNLSDI